VGDIRQMGLDVPVRSEMYFPLTQYPLGGTFSWPRHLVIRTTGDPMRLAPDVRRAIWSVDPDQPISNIRTMDKILDKRDVQPPHPNAAARGIRRVGTCAGVGRPVRRVVVPRRATDTGDRP